MEKGLKIENFYQKNIAIRSIKLSVKLKVVSYKRLRH